MTFTLTLEIDPKATHRDVALALQRAAALVRKTSGTFEFGDRQPIREDGDVIGEWKVE